MTTAGHAREPMMLAMNCRQSIDVGSELCGGAVTNQTDHTCGNHEQHGDEIAGDNEHG